MDDHIRNIITNKDVNLSLFENIMIYLKKNEDKIDMFDIADIIKDDKTFFNALFHECKDKKLLKSKSDISVKLTDVF